MATTTPINGSALVMRMSIDNGLTWKLFASATSATLSRSMETRDITTKQACGWRKLGEGKLSWNLSGEGLVVYDDAQQVVPVDLFQQWAARQKVKIQFTTWDCNAGAPVADDPNYTGDAFITSLEETGGVEDNGSYSFSFEGSEELAQDVNP